jgi:hypothetical protein
MAVNRNSIEGAVIEALKSAPRYDKELAALGRKLDTIIELLRAQAAERTGERPEPPFESEPPDESDGISEEVGGLR